MKIEYSYKAPDLKTVVLQPMAVICQSSGSGSKQSDGDDYDDIEMT